MGLRTGPASTPQRSSLSLCKEELLDEDPAQVERLRRTLTTRRHRRKKTVSTLGSASRFPARAQAWRPPRAHPSTGGQRPAAAAAHARSAPRTRALSPAGSGSQRWRLQALGPLLVPPRLPPFMRRPSPFLPRCSCRRLSAHPSRARRKGPAPAWRQPRPALPFRHCAVSDSPTAAAGRGRGRGRRGARCRHLTHGPAPPAGTRHAIGCPSPVLSQSQRGSVAPAVVVPLGLSVPSLRLPSAHRRKNCCGIHV